MPEDWIRVSHIRSYGYHGVYPKERIIGQIFEADVDLCMDLSPASESDDIGDTIDYMSIYRLVDRILIGRSHKILESLAFQIARVLFQTYPALRVVIRIRKPDIRFVGQLGGIEVELQRDRHEII